MGTRSLTHIVDAESETTLVSFYRQFDGYPAGLGTELAGLADRTIVNGFGAGMSAQTHANGPGCLAAQIIAGLKDGLGNVYIVPPDTAGMGEEFVYTVHVPTEGTPTIDCLDVHEGPIVDKCEPANWHNTIAALSA